MAKKIILVSDCMEYQAEVRGGILTVYTWGPNWYEEGIEIGVVDLDQCKIVKYPEDITDMGALVAAVRALDPGYGLDEFEIFQRED